MCGGSDIPPQPDPIALERERARIARENEQRRIAQEQARFETDTSAFEESLGRASGSALERALGAVEARGLDRGEFEPLIQSEVQRIASGIDRPVLGTAGFTNPTPFFSDTDIADLVLNRERDTRRQNFSNDILGSAPEGFARDLLPNTTDDPILQAILGPQFESANSQLQNAFSVGNLSRSGLDAALRSLEEQRTSALANLNQIGGDVLSTSRDELRGIRERGLGQARAFELGQTFDPSGVQSRIDTSLGDIQSNLEGNIRGAVGSEPLFNVNRILSQTRQGAFNPIRDTGAPNLAAALSERERERNQRRGIGNTGAF